MPSRKTGNTSGRQVGRGKTAKYRELTNNQRLMMGALIAYCLGRDTAVFVGTPTTTGSLRLNLYPPDDKCTGSLNLQDNWFEEVPILLSDVFEEEISLADIEAAVPWLARLASEAPPEAKPSRTTREAVLVPQGRS